MPQKSLFILLIFLWSFAETLLVPFYPQFFEKVYGSSNPHLVGWFFAGCRFILIFAYPFWVKMEKKFSAGKTLIFCQLLGGCLCGGSIFAPNATLFILIYFLMVAVKGSYLLIYPLLIEHANSNQRMGLIGKVAFATNAGMILSALLAGWFMEHFDLRWLLFINMLFDFGQAGISYLIHQQISQQNQNQSAPAVEEKQSSPTGLFHLSKPIWILGTMIFILYFSIYIIRPFFTKYLETHTLFIASYSLFGLLFSIPSIVALCCAPFLKKVLAKFSIQKFGSIWISLAGVSVLLQVLTNQLYPFLLGRITFGISIFFLGGLMDYCLFQQSKKKQATANYRISTTAQNMARLAAPITAGISVETFSLNMPFYLSAAAFLPLLLALWLFTYSLKRKDASYVHLPKAA